MIEIKDLSADLGSFSLRHIDLTVQDGEYLVLLGPTGAGKTVLLECIVGIERRHRGSILIDGHDVTRQFPEERNVGYVPQDYALFPNMTVEENLAYGPRARGASRAVITERVSAMLVQLNLGALAQRFPLNLSGGEKQRVALGRALVTDPHVLLLDEPLSALDENTRSELASDLKKTQQAVHGKFLHVCHNLEEAMEVADRIAIIRDGMLVQVGTADEILRRPATLFVAEFTRARNLLPGHAELSGDGSLVQLDGGPQIRSATQMSGRIVASFRPEAIVPIEDAENSAADNRFACTVVKQTPRLSGLEVELMTGVKLIMHLGHREAAPSPHDGHQMQVRVPPEAVRLFPATSS